MSYPIPPKVANKVLKAKSNARVEQRTKEILAERKQAATAAQLSINAPIEKPIEKPKQIEEVILSSQEVYKPPEPIIEQPKEMQLVKLEKKPKGRPKKELTTKELKTIDDTDEQLNKPMKVVKMERAPPAESCHAITNAKTRCKNPIHEDLLCKLHLRAKKAETQTIPLVKNITNDKSDIATLVLQEVAPLSETNSTA